MARPPPAPGGAVLPRVLLIGYDLNAFTTAVGVRRTRVLGLDGDRANGLVELISAIITRLVSGVARTLQLLLVWTSQRDSQRAEYLADEMAARAAGTDAAISLADHLVAITAIDTVVRREARAGNGMAAWHDAARIARTNLAANLPVLRRLTRHTEVSLYASHPPTGLRAGMLERRPRQAAAVTLTETEAAHLDNELATHQRRALRELTA